jgi:hypothetical protein
LDVIPVEGLMAPNELFKSYGFGENSFRNCEERKKLTRAKGGYSEVAPKDVMVAI